MKIWYLYIYIGGKHENVRLCIEKFESFSCSLNLTEIQKFIFAERALRGISFSFLKIESNTRSLIEFKEALITEFSTQINCAEIHEIISHLCKSDKKSPFEYFLIMKEMASRIDIYNHTH